MQQYQRTIIQRPPFAIVCSLDSIPLAPAGRRPLESFARAVDECGSCLHQQNDGDDVAFQPDHGRTLTLIKADV